MNSVEDLDVVVLPVIDIDASDEISVLPIIKLESDDVNGNRNVNPISLVDDDDDEWAGVTVYDIDGDLDSDSKFSKELDQPINGETVEVVEVCFDMNRNGWDCNRALNISRLTQIWSLPGSCKESMTKKQQNVEPPLGTMMK